MGTLSKQLCKHYPRVSFSSSPEEQNNREARAQFGHHFEVDELTRKGETSGIGLGGGVGDTDIDNPTPLMAQHAYDTASFSM